MISPYLELPVCGEVAAVEAGVELHPVPGHAPGPAPGHSGRVWRQRGLRSGGGGHGHQARPH